MSEQPWRQSPNEPKRRPVLRARPPAGAAGPDPAGELVARLAAAESSAAGLVQAGHDSDADVERLVHLADEVGLDELAHVWACAEAGTLPAALWAVYALRGWCRARPGEVSRLVAAGRPHAEVSAGVAGLPSVMTPPDVVELGDELVRGVVSRDLPTALHRAAALARVLAAGRGATGEDTVSSEPADAAAWGQAVLGVRLLATAESLDAAAARTASDGPGEAGDD